MTNITIKRIGTDSEGVPRYATSKVFVRAANHLNLEENYPPLKAGEIVALEDDEASRLLNSLVDVLEMTARKPTRPSPPPLNAGDADAPAPVPDEAIVEAIRAMDLTDGSIWTASGLARVEHLEGILEREITATARDVAMVVITDERQAAAEARE